MSLQGGARQAQPAKPSLWQVYSREAAHAAEPSLKAGRAVRGDVIADPLTTQVDANQDRGVARQGLGGRQAQGELRIRVGLERDL